MAVLKYPYLTDLSHELLCHILQYLPLKELLSISMLCKKLMISVAMHLRLRKEIDFCESKVFDFMPSSITDDHMHALLKKCPQLETVYGLHPLRVERRRLRKRSALTVPGIIEALSLCNNLKSVETSDLRLLEAIIHNLPQLDIIGHFMNRDGVFPPHASQRLKLLPYPRISSLHLTGVEVPELTAMPHLQHLHLQCVRFTKLQPFRAFLAQNLKTFVMKHCIGPNPSLRYLSLIIALSSSPLLTRLELVRVPLPGGLFQRAVEDSYRHNGFVNLKTLVISACKGVLEADLGHLMIVASKNLESVFIQPSLTRDSLFVSLSFAQCEFPKLKNLHLGFVDKIEPRGEWTNESLVFVGLAEVPDTPSSLTDSGMKVISQLFPNIKSMSVSNCPHLMAMDQWSPIDGEQAWKELTDLTLQRCHCLQLPSFALFLAFLPKIEVVILNDMFREPPKGCSHVGLSAGTGLGMSSAVVSNQDEHIAVQGHQQDFELQPDDPLENDDLDREFIDVENDERENPDQHIMVLQQEFFDEENHIVPAPVVQREGVNPEHRIENMEQEVPENHIRRELNEDYDMYREMSNDEDNKSYCCSVNSKPSHSEEENGQDEDDERESSKSFKAHTSRKNVKKCKRKRMHKSRVLNNHHEPGSSIFVSSSESEENEDRTIKSDRTFNKSSKTPNKTGESVCRHLRECRKKCSKGFDPNQPSTSRDGNCLDCSCLNSDTELNTTASTHITTLHLDSESNFCDKGTQSEFSENIPVSKESNEIIDAEVSGDIPTANAFKYDKVTVKLEPISSDDEVTQIKVVEGPLTRRRKRALDAGDEASKAKHSKCSCDPWIVKVEDSLSNDDKDNNASSAHAASVEPKEKGEDEVRNEPILEESQIKVEPPDPEEAYRRNIANDLEIKIETQDSESYLRPDERDVECAVNDAEIKTETSESEEYVDENGIVVRRDSKHPDEIIINPVLDQSSEERSPEADGSFGRCRKHRKHKHKRCKKGKKCEKSSRRNRPFTRSMKRKYNRDDYNIVNQGTQATSADIRRSLRRQRNCSKKRGSDHCRAHHRSHSAISTRQLLKRPKDQTKPEVDTRNKSTSTSDPLMEDDAVQTLRLVSETLISLTIISCGISDIVIDHCHSMTHVEVQACRILKMFQLHYCPSLKRLGISQCPKLTLNAIIPEVLSLIATRKLLISYEPCMQIYYPAETEKAIFAKAPLDQGIILFHDYTSAANESVQAAFKEHLLRWMEVVQKLYYTPSFWLAKQKKKKSKPKDVKNKFPYGHYLRRIHGVYKLPPSIDPNGIQWKYQILTNDQVFAAALEKVPWDKGFPAPKVAEDYNEDDALLSMIETEYTEKHLKMQKKLISFYIPIYESNL